MLAPSWPESQKSMVETLIKALREVSQRSTNSLTQIARRMQWYCPSCRSSLQLLALTASKKSRRRTGRTRASCLVLWRVSPHHATHRRTDSLPRSLIELSRWFALATWQVATARVPFLQRTSSSASSSIFYSALAWPRMRSRMRLRATSKYSKRTIQTRSGNWKSRMRRRSDVLPRRRPRRLSRQWRRMTWSSCLSVASRICAKRSSGGD